MKKTLKILCFVCAFTLTLSVIAYAQAGRIEWYFGKNNEHKQPPLDKGLEFIEKYNCYYLDKNHGDDCDEKVMYLTFDAGYENGNVEKILDILKEKQVPAAFFILDNLILRNTDLVIRMADEGHLVCNHTMKHKDMSRVTCFEEFETELKGLEKIYNEKTGRELAKFYRPPEGSFTEQNLEFADKMGYSTVLWSFAYPDWDNNNQPDGAKAKEKLINSTHNGEILLLHPTSATNAAILGDLIDAWRADGYSFGRLDDLT